MFTELWVLGFLVEGNLTQADYLERLHRGSGISLKPLQISSRLPRKDKAKGQRGKRLYVSGTTPCLTISCFSVLFTLETQNLIRNH